MNIYKLVTRKSKVSGGLGGGTLADLQGPKKKPASKLCKKHRWKLSTSYQECKVCGLVVDRVG